MRRYRFLPGIRILPLHHSQALRLFQPRGLAAVPQVAQKVPKIPPCGVCIRRAVFGGIGQGCVGVVAREVCHREPVEPPPGLFGVVGGLGRWCSAESRRLAVLPVQVSAEAVPGGQGIDFYLLILRRPGASSTQIPPFSLIGFHIASFSEKGNTFSRRGQRRAGFLFLLLALGASCPPSFSPGPFPRQGTVLNLLPHTSPQRGIRRVDFWLSPHP